MRDSSTRATGVALPACAQMAGRHRVGGIPGWDELKISQLTSLTAAAEADTARSDATEGEGDQSAAGGRKNGAGNSRPRWAGVWRLIGGSVRLRWLRRPGIRVHGGAHHAGCLLEEVPSIQFEVVGHCGIRMRRNWYRSGPGAVFDRVAFGISPGRNVEDQAAVRPQKGANFGGGVRAGRKRTSGRWKQFAFRLPLLDESG